jgi:hypothetical protein
MIPGIAVEKTLKPATGCGVHNLIDSGKPERIFFACLTWKNQLVTVVPDLDSISNCPIYKI